MNSTGPNRPVTISELRAVVSILRSTIERSHVACVRAGTIGIMGAFDPGADVHELDEVIAVLDAEINGPEQAPPGARN